jgi:spore germination protein KA
LLMLKQLLSRKRNQKSLEKLSDNSPSYSLQDNIQFFEREFYNTSDLIIKKLHHGENEIALIYLEPLVDQHELRKSGIIPHHESSCPTMRDLLKSPQIHSTCSMHEGITAILQGNCVLPAENEPNLYIVKAEASFQQSISEPTNEKVISGSHEGLIERWTRIFI